MITKRNYDKLKEQLSEIKNHNLLISQIVNELINIDYEQLCKSEMNILQFIYNDVCWLWEE